MFAWRRFVLRRNRAEREALQQRIMMLEAALANYSAATGRKALRRGLTAAVFVLGLTLSFSLGVHSGSLKQTIAELFAARDFAPAMHDADTAIAAYRMEDYVTALRHLRPLAEQGVVRAQSTIGHMYFHGHGLPQDDLEAIKWFRAAAEQGDAQAQFHLGFVYAEGRSVPQDHAEAAKWYRLAADQGDAQAMYSLAQAYAKGEGLPQDNVNAHMWFNLAATRFSATDGRNRSVAVRNRDSLASTMTGDQIDEAHRLAREWMPK